MAEYPNTYTAFPIMVDGAIKQDLINFMLSRGRDIGSYFYKNLADEPCFSDFAEDCPNARKASKSVMLLPIYPAYSDLEAQANVAAMRDYFRRVRHNGKLAEGR
jgi:dTDP-4-amino-4,6-dideoxygalactose transaminase